MGVTHDTARDAARDPVRKTGSTDAEPQLMRAWASLLEHADVIADDITRNLIAIEEEWFDLADPELRADVRMSTREHIRRGLRTMAGLGTSGDTTELWRETGRRRARQGMPLEFVLNAYTTGTRALWEALLRRQSELNLDDHVMVLAGRRIWSDLDVQNSIMSAAYRREASLLQRRDLQLQGRLLDALVEGRGGDPAIAAEVLEVLGVGQDEPLVCVVAAYDGQRDSPLRHPDDRLEQAGIASYWQVRGDLHFGLVQLGSSSVGDVVEMLGANTTGRVGVAPAPDGVRDFGTAFQLASRTVETIPRGRAEVASVVTRLPEVLLASAPAAADLLVRRTLGPVLALPPHQSAVLLDTLRALIDTGGSPTHAAEALFCHRNTVIYRMRQLQELTDRQLGDAEDRLLFTLALMALGR